MKLDLFIDGETKTFTTPFISGRTLKTTIELSASEELKNVDGKLIDVMADYVAMVYGKQFTADQFLDGTASDAVISTFQATLEGVTGKLDAKLTALAGPNA